MVQAVMSRDGSAIAYELRGRGPALVVVNGALSDRRSTADLAAALASSFTVYAYDRRGRGSSIDHAPYAVEREVEDLAVLLEVIGAPAFLYGHSAGGVLALEAALAGLDVERLVVHEPPYIVPGSRPPVASDLRARLETLLARGDRDEAVATFYREAVGLGAGIVDGLRVSGEWDAQRALAHTLPYDVWLTSGPLPRDRLVDLAIPVLVIVGGASPRWMRQGSEALVEALPQGRLAVLEAQGHVATADAVALELSRFLLGTAAAV